MLDITLYYNTHIQVLVLVYFLLLLPPKVDKAMR